MLVASIAGCSGDGGDGSDDPLGDDTGGGADGGDSTGDGSGAGVSLPGSPERATGNRWPAFRATATNSGASATDVPPQGGEGVTWRGRVDGRVLTGVAVTPDAVYVPSDAGVLTALDRGSGDERWRYEAGDALSAPFVADGTVYVNTGRAVHAVSTDGDPRWQTPLAESTSAVGGASVQERTAPGPVVSAPTLSDGTLFVGGPEGSVVAIGTDGERRWTASLAESTGAVAGRTQEAQAAQVVGTPAVRDDTVLVGTRDGRVHARSTADGSAVWNRPVGAPVTASVAAPGAVAVVRAGERVLGLAVESGERRWSVPLSDGGAGVAGGSAVAGRAQETTAVQASPAVADGTVYQRAGGRLVAVSTDSGQVEWTTDLGGTAAVGGAAVARQRAPPATSSAVVGGGYVVVATADGVAGVRTDTGDVSWSVATESAVYASPALVDWLAVVADADGRVYGVA